MRFLPSPNHSERTRPVSLVVLHYTETPTLERAVRILTDPDLPHPVSSHYVVGLDGEIVQLVPEDRRARHAVLAHLALLLGVCRFRVLDVLQTQLLRFANILSDRIRRDLLDP